MIRVRDHIDSIIEDCFSEDNKRVLEFQQARTTITLKQQFLYHHSDACYTGTKDELKTAIMYRINQNEDLLIKIEDYTNNIRKITDLEEYNKVNLTGRDTLGSESNLNVSGSSSESNSLQLDKFTALDKNKNTSITDDTQASSQSNILKGVDKLIPSYELTESTDQNIQISKLSESNTLSNEELIYKDHTLNKTVKDNLSNYGFQNLGKELSATQTANTNTTTTTRGTQNKDSSINKHSSFHTKGSKTNELNRSIEYSTNSARIKLWKAELPKLRTQFWNSFSSLFTYEWY